MSQISEETITWKKLSASTFFLSAEKTLIKTELELLAFDFEDLVNGIGGALGLFLGWSILYILTQCYLLLPPLIHTGTTIVNKIEKTF